MPTTIYSTPMILNVFMVFVTIFSMLLLLKFKTLADYLCKIHALFHELNDVLPTAMVKVFHGFFMVLALHGLANRYS